MRSAGAYQRGPAPTLITRLSATLTATSAWLPWRSRSRSEAQIPGRAGITTSPGYWNLTARLTGPDLERRPVYCSSRACVGGFARSGRCGSHRGRTPPRGVSPYGRGSHRARGISSAATRFEQARQGGGPAGPDPARRRHGAPRGVVSVLWRELHLGTPEAARSAVGPWRLTPRPLVPCTRTTRCPTTSTRESSRSLLRSRARIAGRADDRRWRVHAQWRSAVRRALGGRAARDAEGIGGSDFPSAAAGLAALR